MNAETLLLLAHILHWLFLTTSQCQNIVYALRHKYDAHEVVPNLLTCTRCACSKKWTTTLHLLQAIFHFGPDVGSSTKTPLSHSTHCPMPKELSECWQDGWVHSLHPRPGNWGEKKHLLTQFLLRERLNPTSATMAKITRDHILCYLSSCPWKGDCWSSRDTGGSSCPGPQRSTGRAQSHPVGSAAPCKAWWLHSGEGCRSRHSGSSGACWAWPAKEQLWFKE